MSAQVALQMLNDQQVTSQQRDQDEIDRLDALRNAYKQPGSTIRNDVQTLLSNVKLLTKEDYNNAHPACLRGISDIFCPVSEDQVYVKIDVPAVGRYEWAQQVIPAMVEYYKARNFELCHVCIGENRELKIYESLTGFYSRKDLYMTGERPRPSTKKGRLGFKIGRALDNVLGDGENARKEDVYRQWSVVLKPIITPC